MSLLLLLKATSQWGAETDGGVAVGGARVAVSWTLGDEAIGSTGGVEVGGDGSTPTTLWMHVADGGVEAGGDGSRITADVFGITGGVAVGGDTVGVEQTVPTDAEPGGVVAGGDSAAMETVFGEGSSTGGVEVGGDAVDASFSTTFDDIGDGGARVGGDAVTISETYFHVANGGVKVGGDGTGNLQSIYYMDVGDAGGIATGGDGTGVVTNVSGDGDTWTNGTDRHRGPTNQRAILIALRNHIVTSGLVYDHQASISTEPIEDTFAPTGEPYIVVAPGNKDVDQGFFAGGGRESDLQTEAIEVRLYQRSALDRMQEQTIWTTHPTRGGYPIARNLAVELHELDLVDGAGTLIVAEPIRILTTSLPRKVRSNTGWGYISTIVAVSFTSDLLVEAAGA